MNWCRTALGNIKRPIACTFDYLFEHKPYDDPETMAFHNPFRNHVDIYLEKIDNLYELYNTIRHEALHECFLSEDLDADVEHKMIDAIDWMDDVDITTDISAD